MTRILDWQARVGDVWAEEWRRTDRAFAGLATQLDAAIADAAPTLPGIVLDIGCGAGATTLALAAARPDLAVHGVDISPALIDTARARATIGNAHFHLGDVVDLAAGLAPVDLYVSRHGVMFFPDPAAAFAALRAAASPDATLFFTCFARVADNPWATLISPVPSPSPAYFPGPFAFADPDRVRDLLAAAGWQSATPERIDFAYRVGEGVDPVADAVSFLSRIGPAASVLHDAGENDRPRLRERLVAALENHRAGSRVECPASAWLWRARAGEPA